MRCLSTAFLSIFAFSSLIQAKEMMEEEKPIGTQVQNTSLKPLVRSKGVAENLADLGKEKGKGSILHHKTISKKANRPDQSKSKRKRKYGKDCTAASKH